MPILNVPSTRLPAVLSCLLFISHASYAQTTVDSPGPNVAPLAPAPSQDEPQKVKKRRIPPIGADVEVIYLLNSKARDNFGSTLVSLGPGLGDLTPSPEGKWGVDFSLTRTDNTVAGNKNKLFMLAIGPEYRRAYIPSKFRRAFEESRAASKAGQDTTQPQGAQLRRPAFMPYYGASLNAIYAKVEVPGSSIDGAGFGVGGTVLAGTTIKQRAFLEARLRAVSNVKSFNFSGASLTFGVRF